MSPRSICYRKLVSRQRCYWAVQSLQPVSRFYRNTLNICPIVSFRWHLICWSDIWIVIAARSYSQFDRPFKATSRKSDLRDCCGCKIVDWSIISIRTCCFDRLRIGETVYPRIPTFVGNAVCFYCTQKSMCGGNPRDSVNRDCSVPNANHIARESLEGYTRYHHVRAKWMLYMGHTGIKTVL